MAKRSLIPETQPIIRHSLSGGWIIFAGCFHCLLAEKEPGGLSSRAFGDQLSQCATAGPAAILSPPVSVGNEAYCLGLHNDTMSDTQVFEVDVK